MEQTNLVLGNYILERKVGEGAFSVVYKSKELLTGHVYCLKILTKTVGSARVADEIIYLKKMKGKKNVIQILNCFREKDQIVLVFPYFIAIDFKYFLEFITEEEVKDYMKNLLKGVKEIHEEDIIHRDIKPGNFLYCPKKRKGMLIDFGLAQTNKFSGRAEGEIKIEKNKKSIQFFSSVVSSNISSEINTPGYYLDDTRPPLKASRAGTRGFRAPEILFKSTNQTEKIDVWSVGVIFLILLTRKYPFFKSTDDIDGLVEIACIFGHSEMKKLANHLGRTFSSNINSIPHEKILFIDIIKKCRESIDENVILAVDLLDKMLELIPEKRISAGEALGHPFFTNK